MTFLIAPTEAAARLLERKAWAYCIEKLDCQGGNWSDVWSDGKRFGILWDNQLAGAFNLKELGGISTKMLGETVTTNANVIEVKSEEWKVVPLPVPKDVP
jgi:hypothetical protein